MKPNRIPSFLMHPIIRSIMSFLMVVLVGISPSSGDPGTPVRMAYLQNDIHHLACWTALEKGMYTQRGVLVEIAGVFRAGPEIMTAFAAGELDMAYVGEAPATIAVANRTAKVIAVAQVNTEGSAIVVSKDKSILGLSDLVAKTVAVPGHGTVQDFLLRRALRHGNIDIKAVNIIVLKPPEMIGALRSNQIDAFIAWEPYPSKVVALEVGKRLADSSTLWNGHPCCVLVASADFMNKYPDRVAAIVDAHTAATQFIQDNPEEAIRIGMNYTGMDNATVRDAVKFVNYTVQLNVAGEAEYVQYLKQLNYIRIEDEDAFIRSFLDTTRIPGKHPAP